MNERGEKKEKIGFYKSGPSNLLVDRTKSIVKLIIFVLSFVVKDESPHSSIWAREVSVLSNNLWSISLKLFRSVQRSLLYKGQWRKKWIVDSTSLPQLHIGLIESWKLWLNLCSREWLNNFNRVVAIIKRIRRRSYEF